MTIKQQSQEWLTKKRKYIGGSEIFSIALHYCKKELEQIGIKNETSFKTALEVYLEKKFDVKPDPISQVCSEFGLGMEDYIINRINQENKNFVATGSKDFIINSDIHELAACSPDGFVEAKEDFIDYDKKEIKASKGMLEVKTTPYQFNFEAEAGTRWAYIFQLQYNMLVCGNDWGLLACLAPKEKEFDNDFFKGKILGKLNLAEYIDQNIEHEYEILNEAQEGVDKYYNLYTYTYKANKTIQNICKLALKRFQEAIDKVILPPITEVETSTKKELCRKMIAKIKKTGGVIKAPKDEEILKMEKLIKAEEKKGKISDNLFLSKIKDEYGTLQAQAELDSLLNDRQITYNEKRKIEDELNEITADVILGMGNATELIGTNYIAKFDKRGTLRVKQNKDSDVTPPMVEQLQAGEFVDFTQGG